MMMTFVNGAVVGVCLLWGVVFAIEGVWPVTIACLVTAIYVSIALPGSPWVDR